MNYSEEEVLKVSNKKSVENLFFWLFYLPMSHNDSEECHTLQTPSIEFKKRSIEYKGISYAEK